MNESEWWSSDDPVPMLICVRGEATDRKLRLFAGACCRHAWNEFVPPLVVAAIEVVEAVADGQLSDMVLTRVHTVMMHRPKLRRIRPASVGTLTVTTRTSAGLRRWPRSPVASDAARRAALAAAFAANDSSAWTTYSGYVSSSQSEHEFVAERAEQAAFARDIFGNPFRPVELDSAWLTSDVLALANAMYANRDFGGMPILADALQDAGCDNDDVLIHCRELCEHVRGCWVVDLLLGKE